MTEKRYLKWYNKVGYGSGDIAGNVVYAFLSSLDRKSTRLNSSHNRESRMPSSA